MEDGHDVTIPALSSRRCSPICALWRHESRLVPTPPPVEYAERKVAAVRRLSRRGRFAVRLVSFLCPIVLGCWT
ncbi:hypothetical protein J437_LFUL014853 [Ladona fulva]|uniref:Uncharacterized protein n=1 Tax=Ladona fulva TaxID=123851 RepID=A0A8K0P754_LADFU|nr:hypothetical protein J437_LFUL014853 [Ladona fulva]